MSTIDFKNAWEEALRRAMLATQPDSELADPALAIAAGLPILSDLRAGVGKSFYSNNCTLSGTPLAAYKGGDDVPMES